MPGQESEDANNLRTVRASTIRMTEDMWAALEAEAQRSGLSTAEIIRQAVIVHLALLERLRAQKR
jgi:Ribbon-helix-helix protein, copG family